MVVIAYFLIRPKTSSEAIRTGIEMLKAGKPEEAIALFQLALELPGNGAMRFAGTVREYRQEPLPHFN